MDEDKTDDKNEVKDEVYIRYIRNVFKYNSPLGSNPITD